IQVPAGAGLWPAFWMLPASHQDDNGEIDIMEMYDTDPTAVYGTVHRLGAQQQHSDAAGTNLSAGWHTFAVDWEPDHITWYLDGTAYATTTSQSLIPTEAMFPIFDLAVGGHNNAPNASTPFPATMNVDYVRIWQK
ncbi:MAG TPA: glycoside hydrolase family 16 protein, partial [Tepidisphaeraceae bacterium]